MNSLLNPLRQIAKDLVDKKLWPVAVVLLVALVAVPVVIGSSAEEEPAPAPIAAVTPGADGAATKSLVTLAEDKPAKDAKSRSGKIADPFYDPPQEKGPAAGSDAGAASGSPSTTTAPKTGGAPAAGGSTAPTTTVEPTEPVVAPVYYRTVIRWGEDEDSKPRPISRLTPLGGLLDPGVQYLGVTKSKGTYAVFLLGPNAVSEGEARCNDDDCRVIGLKSGQQQIVTVVPPDGGAVRQYMLSVVSVRSVEAGAAEARKMRAKVHPDGRDVMRELWSDPTTAKALGPVQYNQTLGLLVQGSGTGAAKAAQ